MLPVPLAPAPPRLDQGIAEANSRGVYRGRRIRGNPWDHGRSQRIRKRTVDRRLITDGGVQQGAAIAQYHLAWLSRNLDSLGQMDMAGQYEIVVVKQAQGSRLLIERGPRRPQRIIRRGELMGDVPEDGPVYQQPGFDAARGAGQRIGLLIAYPLHRGPGSDMSIVAIGGIDHRQPQGAPCAYAEICGPTGRDMRRSVDQLGVSRGGGATREPSCSNGAHSFALCLNGSNSRK